MFKKKNAYKENTYKLQAQNLWYFIILRVYNIRRGFNNITFFLTDIFREDLKREGFQSNLYLCRKSSLAKVKKSLEKHKMMVYPVTCITRTTQQQMQYTERMKHVGNLYPQVFYCNFYETKVLNQQLVRKRSYFLGSHGENINTIIYVLILFNKVSWTKITIRHFVDYVQL